MKKIVINACFGGFGLSRLAQKEYLKLKGKEAYFYKQTKHKFDGGIDEYVKVKDNEGGSIFGYTFTKDFGDLTNSFSDKDCFYDRDIPRDDKDLVLVVEKLGKKASDDCAELKVVKIPTNVDWVIDEYDGSESVEERHRSWS